MPRIKRQHLKRQKDGRFYCKYQGIMFSGNTEDEALEKREEYKRTQRRAVRVNQTFGEYAAYWLPIHKAGVKDSTYNAYASILTTVSKPISGIYLQAMTPDHIAGAFALIADKSASYIHKARILITEILDSAEDAGLLQKNPARAKSVKAPKGTRGTHRAITPEERALIESTPHRMQLLALVMLYCGLRRGEALAVRADDFQGDSLIVSRAVYYVSNQPIIDTPKTEKSTRRVPVPEFIREMIPEIGYISNTPLPLTESAFSRGWENYLQALSAAAGYPVNIRCHDLRHTYCTMLRDAGIDIHQALIWMGHADEKMILKVYDHPGEIRESDAKNRLQSAFSLRNGLQANKKTAETR